MPDSPRSRLLANLKLANTHHSIVHSIEFQAVADLALLQVVKDTTENQPGAVIDMPNRYAFIAGAQYMLETLVNIANPPPESPPVTRTDRLT